MIKYSLFAQVSDRCLVSSVLYDICTSFSAIKLAIHLSVQSVLMVFVQCLKMPQVSVLIRTTPWHFQPFSVMSNVCSGWLPSLSSGSFLFLWMSAAVALDSCEFWGHLTLPSYRGKMGPILCRKCQNSKLPRIFRFFRVLRIVGKAGTCGRFIHVSAILAWGISTPVRWCTLKVFFATEHNICESWVLNSVEIVLSRIRSKRAFVPETFESITSTDCAKYFMCHTRAGNHWNDSSRLWSISEVMHAYSSVSVPCTQYKNYKRVCVCTMKGEGFILHKFI